MENTLENKSKFFAMYWRQKIFKSSIKQIIPYKNTFGKSIRRNDFLELKPLSSISDYEAIEAAKIVCPEMFQFAKDDPIKIERQSDWITVWRKRNELSVDIDFLGYATCQNEEIEYKRNSVGTTYVVDYLRSRGYALPWMGLSIEELVTRGWVKLK